jgi:hypothetical protein
MRRRAIASFIVACALSACASQTTTQLVGAADASWAMSTVEGEGLKLTFGRPDSDNVDLMMVCQPRSGRVTISVPKLADGRAAMLELRSEGAVSRHPATAPTGGYEIFEAEFSARDPALTRFGRSGEIAYAVPGRRARLPKSADAAAFVAGCRA